MYILNMFPKPFCSFAVILVVVPVRGWIYSTWSFIALILVCYYTVTTLQFQFLWQKR